MFSDLPRFMFLLKNQEQSMAESLVRKHANAKAVSWSAAANKENHFSLVQDLHFELKSWMNRVKLDESSLPVVLTLQLRMLQTFFDVYSDSLEAGRSAGAQRGARPVRGRDRRTIF
eukprot:TRINITY_DN4071_c0_g2_i1.p2 TRINITY_DN4071_c0_g2~~TRINITY_DN4071_c0_g2_i1.p2  ORF type:complete len:116 (-),score=30.01 TRINITY_DN4071_c0_g2_i1:119-466(-)